MSELQGLLQQANQMDLSTVANGWVENYLEALLATGTPVGIRATTTTPPGHGGSGAKAAGKAESKKTADVSAEEEDRIICAKYYVNQILGMNEEGIRQAWHKSCRTGIIKEEKDARAEYLSWRVWGMKRKRAGLQHEVSRATAEEEDDVRDAARLTSLSVQALTGADVDDVSPFAIGDNETSLLTPGGSGELSASFGTDISASAGAGRTWLSGDSATGGAAAAGGGGSSSSAAGRAAPGVRRSGSDAGVAPGAAPSSAAAAAAAAATAGVAPSISPEDLLLVNRFPRLYIVLISLHGLVRGDKMELGRDPDTGGQVKYVVELARSLGRIPSVARVDLLTRMVADPSVDKSYSVPEERLGEDGSSSGAAASANDAATAAAHQLLAGNQSANGEEGEQPSKLRSSSIGGSNEDPRGAFIVRLPAGPENMYLRKEDLWPHIREFSDHAILHITQTLARLQESGEPAELYCVHGHYADAGEAASLISATLGCDMALTGHSLGRNKKAHLLASGTCGPSEMESAYRITRRIEGEERALDAASAVFTSTQEEVKMQWGIYDGYPEQLSTVLALRPCKGYHVPRMAVIAPGLDFSNIKVPMPQDPWEALTKWAAAGASAVERTSGGGAGPGGVVASPQAASDAGSEFTAMTSGATTPGSRVSFTGTAAPASPIAGVAIGAKPPVMAAKNASASDLAAVNLQPNGNGELPSLAFASKDGVAAAAAAAATPAPAGASKSAKATPTASPPRTPRRSGGLSSPQNSFVEGSGNSTKGTGSNSQVLLGGGPSLSGGSNSQSQYLVGSALVGGPLPDPPIWREVQRFLRNPRKPVILAMSRPDAKKNVAGLLRAYGSSSVLRELANLVLVLGNRDAIDSMAPGSASVMTTVLKLIDGYNLYGSVAYPKRHAQSDISDIYLLAAATKGVFVNIALQEPFGLTLIEAAAHGVPIVATTNGGPVDIVGTLHNGILVDPTNSTQTANAICSLITNTELWDTCAANGRSNILAYCWPSHCLRYLKTLEEQRQRQRGISASGGAGPGTGGPAGRRRGETKGSRDNLSRLSLSFDDLSHLTRTIEETLSQPQLSGAAGAGGSGAHGAQLNTIAESPRNSRPVSGTVTPARNLGGSGAVSGTATPRGGSAFSNDKPAVPHSASAGQLQLSAAAGSGSHAHLLDGIEEMTSRHHSLDDMAFEQAVKRGFDLPRSGPRLVKRSQFVVLSVDAPDDFAQAVGIIKACRAGKVADLGLREVLGDAANQMTGFGLMAVPDVQETRRLVLEAGGDVGDLDFLVCGAGAQVWYNQQGTGSTPVPTCDEDYERHLDFRWDANAVKQVLRRICKHKEGWGNLPLGDTRNRPMLALHGNPFQVTLTIGLRGNNTNIDGSQLVARFRRKLRRCGVRAQLLLTSYVGIGSAAGGGATESASPFRASSIALTTSASGSVAGMSAFASAGSFSGGAAPSFSAGAAPSFSSPSQAPGGAITATLQLQLTPPRGSRTLAMRYLAHRHKLDLGAFTLVAFAAPHGAVGTQAAGSPGKALGSGGAASAMARQKSLGVAGGLGGVDAAGNGAAGRMGARMLASDGEDLLGGVQRVLLLSSIGAANVVCNFPLDLSPYDPERVMAAEDVVAPAPAP